MLQSGHAYSDVHELHEVQYNMPVRPEYNVRAHTQ